MCGMHVGSEAPELELEDKTTETVKNLVVELMHMDIEN